MSATVLTVDAAKAAKIDVITDEVKGTQAVHDAVVALRANRRSGTANCKTKAEVNLSGAKPWRQKGTGRARAGYKSSPVWVGGGVVFGPKPRDYSKKVSKQVKRLALRKAFSARLLAGDVLLVDNFAVGDGKTKSFISLLTDTAGASEKILIVGTRFDELTFRAARNVQTAQLVSASDVNAEHLLRYNKIVLTQDALAQIAERSAKK